MGRLDGKVAIITGSASGIGAACAGRYAHEGASVVIADIAEDAAHRTADSIRQRGGQALAVRVDVADESQIAALVETTIDHFHSLDILHNNAAIQDLEHMGRDNQVGEQEIEVWDRTFDVNLRGYMLGCKHAIPKMIDFGGGSIINTSSRGGSLGDLSNTAYGVSKGAIDIFTLYVATQYGKQNIRCNALVIAGVVTDRLRQMTDEAWRERMINNLATPYMGTPEDIAAAALFLASDEARFVTGALLAVDGGFGCHNSRYAQTLEVTQVQ